MTGEKQQMEVLQKLKKLNIKAEYVEASTAWIKKVVITFKHDLKVDTAANYAGLFSNEVDIKTGTLNVLPDALYNSNGFTNGYKQSGNQVSIKVEDNPPFPNGKLTYDDVNNGNISVEYTQGQQETDTIFNWLGFKIASFDETLVLPQTGTIIPSVNTPTFAFNRIMAQQIILEN